MRALPRRAGELASAQECHPQIPGDVRCPGTLGDAQGTEGTLETTSVLLGGPASSVSALCPWPSASHPREAFVAVSRAVRGRVRQEGPLSDRWTCPVSPLSWALGVDAGAAPGSQEQPQEAQRPGPLGGEGARVTLFPAGDLEPAGPCRGWPGLDPTSWAASAPGPAGHPELRPPACWSPSSAQKLTLWNTPGQVT